MSFNFTRKTDGDDTVYSEDVNELQEAIEQTDVSVASLDGRVESAEGTLVSQGSSIAANTSGISVHGQRLNLVQYRKPTVAAIGDSITGPQYWGWAHWSCLQPTSKLWFAGAYQTPGYTTAQILATHVPQVIAADPHPGYCYVLAGANDATNAGAFAAFTAAYTDILDTLTDAGIVPIIIAITPNTTTETSATLRLQVVTFNLWLSREARRRGLPFVNWWSVLADTATYVSWKSGYSDDGTHPTLATYQIMGAELERQLRPYLDDIPVFDPGLATTNLDPSNVIANGMFLTDANSDGVADSWAMVVGSGGSGTATREDAVDGDCIGKWQKITQNTPTNFVRLWYNSAISVNPGDRLQIAYRLKIGVNATTGNPGVFGVHRNTATATPVGERFSIAGGGTNPSLDVTARTIFQETIAASDATAMRFTGSLNSGGTGNFSVAQVAVRNLTALGIA